MNRSDWKPAVMIWRWDDAPEEFRALSQINGGEESVIYVPPELIDEDWYENTSVGLDFLSFFPKRGGLHFAGDDFGWYSLHDLPDGGRVAITTRSVRFQGDARSVAT
jgi:hypothetical protein